MYRNLWSQQCLHLSFSVYFLQTQLFDIECKNTEASCRGTLKKHLIPFQRLWSVWEVQMRGSQSWETWDKVLVGGTHQVRCLMRQSKHTVKANAFTPEWLVWTSSTGSRLPERNEWESHSSSDYYLSQERRGIKMKISIHCYCTSHSSFIFMFTLTVHTLWRRKCTHFGLFRKHNHVKLCKILTVFTKSFF